MGTRRPDRWGDGGSRTTPGALARRRFQWVLALALPVLLAQACVPGDRLADRADDAFYYFQLARQFERLGTWTFDGLHWTNGVQPLWAAILCGVAVVASALGVEDRVLLLRVFVGVAALTHWAAVAVLVHVLWRRAAPVVAVVAAGAFLFPPGIVWYRVTGMENALYALLLATVLTWDAAIRKRPSGPGYAAMGALLGLTALARYNAGLLIPIWLGLSLLRRRAPLRLLALAGVCATLVLGADLGWNWVHSGHLLPVSGEVKRVAADFTSDGQALHRGPNLLYLRFLAGRAGRLKLFVTSRTADALWPLGSRYAFPGDGVSLPRFLAPLLSAITVAACFRDRRRVGRLLRTYGRRLARFAYLPLFAAVNLAVSLVLYPFDTWYAMPRWWLVESELVIVVVLAAWVAVMGAALVRRRARVAAVALALLAAHAAFQCGFGAWYFWGHPARRFDWDDARAGATIAAARWLDENTPPGTRVGALNAGVLGYFCTRPVINLDGLMNDTEFLERLRRSEVPQYVRTERITFVADVEDYLRALGPLPLQEVWRRGDYVVARVGPGR